jgi:hypothetical protein
MFAELWKCYPSRNGKKIGKAIAEKQFNKLSPKDQASCLVAVQNYAKCDMVKRGVGIRDCHRFLWDRLNKHEYWREWLEPETVVSVLSDAERDALKRDLKKWQDTLNRQTICRDNYAEMNRDNEVSYWERNIKVSQREIEKIRERLK